MSIVATLLLAVVVLTAALTIGSPILFASVAHGSAHDIAGRGVADPTAMIEAVRLLSRARQAAGLQAATRA